MPSDSPALDTYPGERAGEESRGRRPAPPGSGQERPAGRGQLIMLLAGSCLPVLGAVLIAPVLPQMSDAFAATPGVDVLVPVVLTVPALFIALCAPFAGFVVDALDRKRLLLVAMIAYSLFGTAPLYLHSLGAIVASRALVGLCEAAIMTCCTTLIGDYWSGPQRSRYLGLQVLVAALSATVFLGVGGALGASGWRTPFWLYVVAVPLTIPMARLLWQPERPAAAGALSANRAAPLEPMDWGRMLAPCAVTLFGGIVFYALIVQLSFVLTDAGYPSTSTIGAISALMSLGTAAGAVVFGRVSSSTPHRLLPIEFALAGAGLVTVFSSSSIVLITIGAVLAGFGTGMLLPTLLTWAVNRLTFSQRGRGTGLWTGFLFIGEFLSPLLIAGVGAGVGGREHAIGVLGVAAAVAAVVTAIVLRGSTDRLDDTQA